METECLTLRDLKSQRKRTDMDEEEEEGKQDQKENIFAERRKATPHKSDPGSVALVSRKGLTPEQINVTPIKPLDRALPEPWTPTANLKVLISAISPDIREREMKKILFRPIENGGEVVDHLDQFDPTEDGADEFEKRPNRKQKSLGLLCQKFLSLYPDYPASSDTTSISLDEVATSLAVERRRIYDIVNVLESLMLVSRVAKNHYLWHGRKQLRHTLRGLQDLGKRQGYHLQMEQLRECRHRPCDEPAEENGEADSGSGAARRKEKSLRIMSQKFVMLFLVSETLTVTLDVAAKILIEESQDTASHSKYKTKVRRLYDIANVLTSLGLIHKVHVKEERGRKPAFKWIGPAEFAACEDLEAVEAISYPEFHEDSHSTVLGCGRQRLARHASFNVVPISVATQRRVSSAPSSPRREVTGLISEPVDYSRRAGSNNAVCRLQFGDDRGTQLNGGPKTFTPKNSPVNPGSVLAPLAVPIHQEASFRSVPSLYPEILLPHFYPGTAQSCSLVQDKTPNPLGDEREPLPQNLPVYIPNLPQGSLLMLYGARRWSRRTGTAGVRGHPSSGGMKAKRKLDVVEEGPGGKRDRLVLMEAELSQETRGREEGCESVGSVKTSSPVSPSHGLQRPAGQTQEEAPPRFLRDGETGRQVPPPSHYLYVPNSAGLNGFNFLLSAAGHAPGRLSLSQAGMSALAVPYVMVPASALSAYPLVANGVPATCGDAQGKIGFSIPTVLSPAHFVLGAGSFAVPGAPGFSGPSSAFSNSEQTPSTDSPRQPLSLLKMDPPTPMTPKETGVTTSQAFFQTPGTLATASPPAARRRGSAQRRLDIGHPPAN
ncbi:hypothetical protein AAFF_G00323090 [Aldrovandia affinis]|uniref:Transcription factor E2F7 n=1 Tax=Aldrovandia affinis TaxID=143900 RepID=A0AAD7SN74_9TELE|nr:hypothetical protein AAFF_G00323090 [Aldrovandia affinis]